MQEFWEQFWSAWEWTKTAMALLGLSGLTIGGAAAVAYGLFKWLGEKWIDQKFEKQMEAYKTEQSRELERLRHKINGVFDRTIRLHAKEFEVLPDLWGKLVEAHAWGNNYISPLQTYADVGRMDDEELTEFLEESKFMKAQRRDIKEETHPIKRQAVFTKISDQHRYNDAQERLRTYATSLWKEGVFVKPEIKASMDRMLELIQSAIFEKWVNDSEDIHPRIRDAYKKFKDDAQPLLETIEKAVADRLWDSTTTEI